VALHRKFEQRRKKWGRMNLYPNGCLLPLAGTNGFPEQQKWLKCPDLWARACSSDFICKLHKVAKRPWVRKSLLSVLRNLFLCRYFLFMTFIAILWVNLNMSNMHWFRLWHLVFNFLQIKRNYRSNLISSLFQMSSTKIQISENISLG
jgi:hypothetical protein